MVPSPDDGDGDDAPDEDVDAPANDAGDDDPPADPRVNDAGDADDPPVDPRVGDDDGTSRRWLIRALVALGLGIPIAIEGTTFLGLLNKYFGGGSEGTDTPTSTPDPNLVGVGDDLLPSTPQMEALSNAVVDGGDSERWSLDVVVTVENTGDSPYEVRLGTLTLDDGRTVSGGASTGAVPPGETVTLTEQWTFRGGSLPDRLVVFGFVHGATGDRSSVRREVTLDDIPVKG